MPVKFRLNPTKLSTPEQVHAYQKYQNAIRGADWVKDMFLKQDGSQQDLDGRKDGTVVMDAFVPNPELNAHFTGVVRPDGTMNVERYGVSRAKSGCSCSCTPRKDIWINNWAVEDNDDTISLSATETYRIEIQGQEPWIRNSSKNDFIIDKEGAWGIML